VAERHTLEVGDASVEVDVADGGRLVSLRVEGHQLLGGVGARDYEHGSFLMAPWAGRIRNGLLVVGERVHRLSVDRLPPHAGLGLVLDRPWRATIVEPTRLQMRVDLDDRWPLPGFVVQDLSLEPGHLRLRAEVHAVSGAFPATVGWHPWFRRHLDVGGGAELDFTAHGMLARDETGMPTGDLVTVPPGPWDDCFVGVQWPVRIAWPGALTLSIESDQDHVVVFTERSEGFCVEPQSGPPDGPNTMPTMVAPGAPLRASTTWSWS
jgi:aldose 1-epimerase